MLIYSYLMETALDCINQNMVVQKIGDDNNDDSISNHNHNRSHNNNVKDRAGIGKVIGKVGIGINIRKVKIGHLVFRKRQGGREEGQGYS